VSFVGTLTVEQRFWAKVKKTRTCWLWTGSTIWSGYGQLRHQQNHWLAHRFAWALEHGEVPPRLMHTCDTPNCVRPSHLKPGGQSANLKDCRDKGRGVAKLTKEQAAALCQRYVEGERQVDLAREYGISRQAVHQIVHGKVWA